MGNADCQAKILALERIIQGNKNGISLKRMLYELDNQYGIRAERKSIYRNIDILTRFMPINMKRKGETILYYLEER